MRLLLLLLLLSGHLLHLGLLDLSAGDGIADGC